MNWNLELKQFFIRKRTLLEAGNHILFISITPTYLWSVFGLVHEQPKCYKIATSNGQGNVFYFIVIELSCSVLTHLTVYRTQDRCGGRA